MRLLILCGILLASTLADVSASFATEGPWVYPGREIQRQLQHAKLRNVPHHGLALERLVLAQSELSWRRADIAPEKAAPMIEPGLLVAPVIDHDGNF